MTHRHKRQSRVPKVVSTGVGMVLCGSALAGTATFNFDTDPAQDPNFVTGSNVSWTDPATGEQLDFYEDRDFDGRGENGNPATGGYLAVTRSSNSQYSQILFPDFDAGLVVKAFSFDCDLRLGNATGNDGRPADGFSLNYARAGDPAVDWLKNNPGSSDTSRYAIPSAPEGGTTTGLSICFDTWSGNTWPSGETDIEGIIVRVDNVTVVRYGMPLRNGSCEDVTSLQTGPYNAATGGDFKELCWAKLSVNLAENGELTVKYKGATLLDKAQTGYSASAGRILLAGRTGGANQNNHIDNLVITTIPADTAVIGSATGTPTGFSVTVSDSGPSVFDANAPGAIAVFKLNGNAITANRSSKTGSITTLYYDNPSSAIPAGSANTVSLTVKDTRGVTSAKDVTFTGVSYATLDPAWAAKGIDKTKPGFVLRTHQVSLVDDQGTARGSDAANNGVSVAAGERMLHGDLGPNTADLTLYTGPGGTYTETKVINYNAFVGNIGSFVDDGSVPGNVPSTGDTTASGNLPGLPGSATREGGNDDVTMEILTYVDFPKAGSYQMGFNSDDGFRMTAFANPLEQVNSPIVAQFDNGRGASDTQGWVYVATPGSYGFRVIWMQGGGGANLEFFGINPDGVRALVNDSTTTGALKAYAVNTGALPAAVSFVDPPRGSGRPHLAGAPLVVEITDGSTAISNIKFNLNGADVTPTVTKNGKVSKATYSPAGVLPAGNNTLIVSFTDGTATYSGTHTFAVTGGAAIPPSMALKAADVNKGNAGFLVKTWQLAIMNQGATGENAPGNSTLIGEAMVHNLFGWPNTANLAAFTGPGGSYPETGVINYNGSAGDIGSFQNGWGYPEVQMPGIPGSATAEGGIANYALEIRTVLDLTPGTYHMGVNSDDGFRIIVGDGKEAYTLPIVCGEFDGGRGADNWGFTRFSIKVTQAGLYPLRMVFEQGGGGNNVEWFQITKDGMPDGIGKVLINDPAPLSGVAAIKAYQYPINSTGPTYVKSFAPGRSSLDSAGSTGRAGPDATVKLVLVDGSTPVDTATVSMKINGAAVTPTVNKAGTETTVSYKPAAGFAMGSDYKVEATFGDRTVSWTFKVGLPATPTFWVEAADFDYNGGQSKAEASAMPYMGGAYAGLGATAGTDYKAPFESSNPYYRYPNTLRVPVSFANDRDRGGGEVIVNYRIGWMGSSQWFNYTRNIPQGTYNVYAGLSSGTAGDNMRGNLTDVTGGASTVLGVFAAPAPGGWGNNALVPLKDVATTNTVVALNIGGTKTLRYNDGGGDWDFLLFTPAASAEGPKFTSIKRNADGTVTVEWTGGGTLQAAPAVTGPWEDVTGAASPYTLTPTAPMTFGRLRQ